MIKFGAINFLSTMKKRIGIFIAVLLSSLVSAQQITFNSETNDVVLTANTEQYFEVFLAFNQ